jgi:hypothetical protein
MPGGTPTNGVVARLPAVLVALLLGLLFSQFVAPLAEAGVRQDPAPDPTNEPEPGAGAPGEQAPVQPNGDPPAPVPPASSGVPDATTTTVAVLGPTAASQEQSESDKADQRVQLVVISLLVLAVVVAVATIVFWRRTSPSRVASSSASAVVSRVGKS